jgi:hypothetical protein
MQYFWRVRSADDYYVAAGSFATGADVLSQGSTPHEGVVVSTEEASPGIDAN